MEEIRRVQPEQNTSKHTWNTAVYSKIINREQECHFGVCLFLCKFVYKGTDGSYQWSPTGRTPGSSSPLTTAAEQSSSWWQSSWVWPRCRPPATRAESGQEQSVTYTFNSTQVSCKVYMRTRLHRTTERCQGTKLIHGLRANTSWLQLRAKTNWHTDGRF